MKALKTSHREKRRYLLVSGKDAGRKNIEEAILRFVGILGFAKASPMIVKQKGGKIIVSANRSEVDKIRASLAFSGKDMRVEKISGMINRL